MTLREVRFLKTVTQKRLERMSGVWQSRISDYERGIRLLREDEHTRITKALGVEVDWESGKFPHGG
jgi:transcriptional regulator with XRE-family HTH domain